MHAVNRWVCSGIKEGFAFRPTVGTIHYSTLREGAISVEIEAERERKILQAHINYMIFTSVHTFTASLKESNPKQVHSESCSGKVFFELHH